VQESFVVLNAVQRSSAEFVESEFSAVTSGIAVK
jgi:hypothetical protein